MAFGLCSIDRQALRHVVVQLARQPRALRREIAAEHAVPAYVVLHDATLRELARLRPRLFEELRGVRGLGEKTLADLGPRLCSYASQLRRLSRPTATFLSSICSKSRKEDLRWAP